MEEKNYVVEQTKEDDLAVLRKELKITRYCSLLVAMLLVIVIIGGVFLAKQMAPALTAIQEMQPAIQKMEQIDVEMLNAKIEQLDIEGLNKAIEGLDVEELSKSLKNINEAIDRLKEAGESFEAFSELFSNSFSGLFGIGGSGNSL